MVALAVGRRARGEPAGRPDDCRGRLPGSDYTFWIGLFAPAKTPRDIVDKLQQEVVRVMASAEMRERLATLGAEAWTMPSGPVRRLCGEGVCRECRDRSRGGHQAQLGPPEARCARLPPEGAAPLGRPGGTESQRAVSSDYFKRAMARS